MSCTGRIAKTTILVACEGKADKKFIETYLVPRLKSFTRLISLQIRVAEGNGSRILKRIQGDIGQHDYIIIFADKDC